MNSLVLKKKWHGGFTLMEVLVSISVMLLIMSLLGGMFANTASLIIHSNKAMDADGQARTLLDRMAVDIGSMVKRNDVNYFLKTATAETTCPQNYDLSSANPMTTTGSVPGNDQITFYSTVPGYFSNTATTQSAMSLVGYRLNTSTYQMQRYGRGLFWNGAPGTSSSNSSTGGDQPAYLPIVFGSTSQWPNAISSSATDSDYENLGPPVFRFEYYYLLKSGAFSAVPWDTAAGHTSINGLQDVAAIGVTLAAIDSKSRNVVSNSTLSSLALAMKDFDPSTMSTPGAMETQWRSVCEEGSPVAVPVAAMPNLHIYHRLFFLNTN